VFSLDVRDSLLVKKPEDIQFFTKKQCELINGVPRRDGDQDTLEEILTLSDEEVVFWDKIKQDPKNFLSELGVLETV
jgi:hypothetical protein